MAGEAVKGENLIASGTAWKAAVLRHRHRYPSAANLRCLSKSIELFDATIDPLPPPLSQSVVSKIVEIDCRPIGL